MSRRRQQFQEERSQQTARLLYLAMAALFLGIRPLVGEPGPHENLLAAWLVLLVHGSYTLLIHRWLRTRPTPSVPRRLANLMLDISAASLALYLTGPLGTFFYPMLLWIIVGYGMRFGPRYLIAAEAIAVPQLVTVFSVSAYWSEHIHFTLGLLVGLIVLPVFNWVLINRLHSLNTRLEHRVTERTRELQETNTELARANRAKDEFLATISHELRTPLTAILGLSQLLKDQSDERLSPRQLDFVGTIEDSGRHLLELIPHILDVARIEAGRVRLSSGWVDAREVCEGSLRLVAPQAEKKGIRLGFRLDDGVQRIYCDRLRLKQMLVNLLGNAVKFTADGGQAGLEVEGDASGRVLRLRIWDTGIGIAEQDMPLLFKPFVQLDSRLARQYQGTGLGLVLVYRMAELHGGSLAVESTPGEGSRFTLHLPWPAGGETRIPEHSPESPPALPVTERPLQILLADDSETNLTLLAGWLELRGHHVSRAGDALQALDLAREVHPDLIFMDMQMPGLDGLDACRRIRDDPELERTPIVALSALGIPGHRERCLAAGAVDYLLKPVPVDVLMHTVDRHAGAGRRFHRA